MWARPSIQARACQIFFFFLIMLQVPLFRVPCRTGTCKCPLQITAAQLATSRVVPKGVVKVLLYPGACIHTITSESTLPRWSSLFEQYNLHDISATQILELNSLELLVGSYFAVAGAITGLFKPGRMGFCGVILLVWGLFREGVFDKSRKQTSVYIHPIMLVVVVCVFLAAKYNKQNMQRTLSSPALESVERPRLQ